MKEMIPYKFMVLAILLLLCIATMPAYGADTRSIPSTKLAIDKDYILTEDGIWWETNKNEKILNSEINFAGIYKTLYLKNGREIRNFIISESLSDSDFIIVYLPYDYLGINLNNINRFLKNDYTNISIQKIESRFKIKIGRQEIEAIKSMDPEFPTFIAVTTGWWFTCGHSLVPNDNITWLIGVIKVIGGSCIFGGWSNNTPVWGQVGLGLWCSAWAVDIIDCPAAVERYNKKLSQKYEIPVRISIKPQNNTTYLACEIKF